MMIPDDSSPATPAATRRDGFALPMAILIIAFLTVTIAAAYAATTAEMITNTAQRGESRAYMLAQAGLENFIARRNEATFCNSCGAPPMVDSEYTWVPGLPGGTAYVVAKRVRVAKGNLPAIYLLRSRGVDTMSFVYTDSAGQKVKSYSTRTVAQLVYWNVNQVNVLSGWTSLSGMDKTGSAGTISGADECGVKDTVAGIAVPTGDYSGKNFTPIGDPPIRYIGGPATFKDSVKIDWSGIVNGNRIQPDYWFKSPNASTNATNAWGNIFSAANLANSSFYPVIRVDDDFTLGPSMKGQGTLIVMGNLTLSGSNLWKGILLVGGKMDSNGNGTMSGASESGLNALLTGGVPGGLDSAQKRTTAVLTNNPANAVANGTKAYMYNSCEVAKAAGGLASYSVYPNAWMDNFVTW